MMTGFNTRTTGVINDHLTNCDTTTAPLNILLLLIVSKRRKYCTKEAINCPFKNPFKLRPIKLR